MLVQFLINVKTKFGNSVILRKETDKLFQTILLIQAVLNYAILFQYEMTRQTSNQYLESSAQLK